MSERVLCDREMEKSVTEKERLPVGAKEISVGRVFPQQRLYRDK